ncbi:MAG: hypothetical protein ABSE70_05225 [Candidatus Limnocylindrales bacterium]
MTDGNWSDYLADAGTDGEAPSEASTSTGDAASGQADAAGHVQAANEWAAWGNVEAAQEELDSARTAADIADGVDGAATGPSIGADYMDSADDNLSDPGSDPNP